ncbi:MAG: TIGR03862 family flavoprotein [Pseudomonadota bacterium]
MTAPVACVIGGGPAGLMAAEILSGAGVEVTVCDAKPSLGRKFLMAGKSGLNLTMAAPEDQILAAYGDAAPWLTPMVSAFGPSEVMSWAEGLGQPLFQGSTGRVFPQTMKASPLLRAWLARLSQAGVRLHTRWTWRGWQGSQLQFETPDGPRSKHADVTVLALGGASWARLGSDGLWAPVLAAEGADVTPFAPSNAALKVDWSPHMAPLFGEPIKAVSWSAGPHHGRGEAILTKTGLEGGGIYAISHALRAGAPLRVDLTPDLSRAEVAQRLARRRGKTSLSNHIRKVLNLAPIKRALLMECARPLPADPNALADTIKALAIPVKGLALMDEAISTAGGVCRSALDSRLMLTARPGTFVAGEMLDWEAPTGGYLLTACLATGRWAGLGALDWVERHR